MKKGILSALISLCLLVGCKNKISLSKIGAQRIEINDSIAPNKDIEAFITPFRNHVDSSLNAAVSYSKTYYSKKDGELNTAIGNMMADAVMKQAGPVFKSRTGHTLDFVLLNHGGIRSTIPKGAVTKRTAYEVMPFENEVVVVGLPGNQVNKLLVYLKSSKRAHPVSKELELILNRDYDILSARIKGETIDPDRIYYVATSDYLFNGGDRMSFFQPNALFEELDYKIRNILIDYFMTVDTLSASIDNRFIRKTAG